MAAFATAVPAVAPAQQGYAELAAARRAMAGPDANASRHPCWPQVQTGPSVAAMAYQAPRMVRLADIPLPVQPRTTSTAHTPSAAIAVPSAPVEAAPLEAPAGVGPETGREGTITTPSVPSTDGLGDGGAADFGAFEPVVAPPSAPLPVAPVRLHSGIQSPERTVYVEPVYLRIPPGHEKHWSKHCGEYGACGRPVYFVREDWYQKTYVPYYRDQKGGDEEKGGGKEKHGKSKGRD